MGAALLSTLGRSTGLTLPLVVLCEPSACPLCGNGLPLQNTTEFTKQSVDGADWIPSTPDAWLWPPSFCLPSRTSCCQQAFVHGHACEGHRTVSGTNHLQPHELHVCCEEWQRGAAEVTDAVEVVLLHKFLQTGHPMQLSETAALVRIAVVLACNRWCQGAFSGKSGSAHRRTVTEQRVCCVMHPAPASRRTAS